jgi:hypothetical protein
MSEASLQVRRMFTVRALIYSSSAQWFSLLLDASAAQDSSSHGVVKLVRSELFLQCEAFDNRQVGEAGDDLLARSPFKPPRNKACGPPENS